MKSEKESMELMESLSEDDSNLQEFYVEMVEAGAPESYKEGVDERLDSLKRTSANLMKAYKKSLAMYDELSARWKDLDKSSGRKIIPRAPANSVIDIEEQRRMHFAEGLNPYKMMLVCFIGSFAGVVIEVIWCLLKNGYIESRAGLIYGPFNLLYGGAAVVLTLALYKYRNKGRWLSFIGGFVVGSGVEYLCSWAQETVFGSRSWDYTDMPFDLNGRICLLYSLFWGCLGVLWVKTLYPVMAQMILKLPNKTGKILSWACTAFLIFNAVVSVIAVFRWSQRLDMIPPSSQFWEFIDLRFTNERMERIFANMVFN